MAGLAQRGGAVVPLATAARENATETLKHVTLELGGKSPVVIDTALPFGGYKQSGIGHEQGRLGIEAYLETKTVIIQL